MKTEIHIIITIFEVAGIDYSAVSASLNDGDYDIATVPSNVARYYNNNDAMKERCFGYRYR